MRSSQPWKGDTKAAAIEGEEEKFAVASATRPFHAATPAYQVRDLETPAGKLRRTGSMPASKVGAMWTTTRKMPNNGEISLGKLVGRERT